MGIYVFAFDDSRPLRQKLAIAFGASAITHPIVWFVLPPLLTLEVAHLPWMTMVWIAEAFAVVAETLWLFAFGVRYAPLWALGANMASFGAGLVCYRYLGW